MTDLEIESFLTAAKEENITRAAEKLSLTQPALSRRLLSLEQELNCPLLIRRKGNHKVLLTEQGKALLPIAEEWQRLYRAALRVGTDVRPILRMATNESLGTYFMPPVYAWLRETHPEIRLIIDTVRSDLAYTVVEQGSMNAALVVRQRVSREAVTVPVLREKMLLLYHGSSLVGEKPNASDLDVREEIYLPWSDEFRDWHDYWFGRNAEPGISCDPVTVLEQFIVLPGHWAIAPASAAMEIERRTGILARTMNNGPRDRICCVVSNQVDGPAVKLLLESIRACYGGKTRWMTLLPDT